MKTEFLQSLAAPFHNTELSNLQGSYSGVQVNSKSQLPGQLFFALKGAKTDGHLFVKEASQAGASAVVVEKGFTGEVSCPVIYVEDTLNALQELAAYRLKQIKARVLAITGSVGKTTTKEFLSTLLSTNWKIASTVGNQNSQIGLPLSILNEVEGDEDYLVLEMSLTHKGHIKRLTEIAPPDVALINSIEPVHIENFSSLEELALAKKEIISHPKTTHAIISADCPFLEHLMEGALNKKTYSLRNSADWMLKVGENSLILQERGCSIHLPHISLPGEPFYHNLLGAIALARSIGLPVEKIERGLSCIRLPKRRFQELIKGGIFFIDDAYNAAEASMKAALSAVAEKKHTGRKIAILGQMTELGKISEETHRRVALHALECVDELVCFGANCVPITEVWNREKRDSPLFIEMDELISFLKDYLVSGDLVLLKGSRSNRLERVLEAF